MFRSGETWCYRIYCAVKCQDYSIKTERVIEILKEQAQKLDKDVYIRGLTEQIKRIVDLDKEISTLRNLNNLLTARLVDSSSTTINFENDIVELTKLNGKMIKSIQTLEKNNEHYDSK